MEANFTLMKELVNKEPSEIVRLDLIGHYFQKDFIKECIKELQTKSMMVKVEIDEYTKSELLVILLLMDSSLLNNQ